MAVDAASLLQALAVAAAPPAVQPPPGRGPGKVSFKHNEIMDYLLVNPNVKLADVAAHFGFTPGWLSQVIHSDAFQTLLREKQGYAFHSTVLSVKEKMENIAHQALDKLSDSLANENDAETLSGIAGNMLDRLGFGTKNSQNPQAPGGNTYVTVLAGEIQAARALIHQRPNGALEVGLGASRVAVLSSSETVVGEAGVVATIQPAGGEGSESSEGTKVRGEGP